MDGDSEGVVDGMEGLGDAELVAIGYGEGVADELLPGVLRERLKLLISKAAPMAAEASRPVFPVSRMVPILPRTAIARKATPATRSSVVIGAETMALTISSIDI